MQKVFHLLVLMFVVSFVFAQRGTVTGTITDASTSEPLIGANLLVKDSYTGTVSDLDGNYTLVVEAGTVILECSFVGYESASREVTVSDGGSITVNFTLELGGIFGDEIVISGSKRPEKLTESPATIETIFAREIMEYAGNPAELVARQKGIEYFRAGIATPAFNIRGFNSNFNSKNLQVTDGRFSTLVATGLPFGPLNTTIKEDIERVEVILGPNATLYGPNAHNGLLDTITKDPRTSAGTMLTLNGGISGDGDPLYSVRARHAQVLSDKVAFKVMGEYTAATEFEWSDSVFIDRLDSKGVLRSSPNYEGPDGVAEGWNELELNPDVDFTRLEGALYWTPAEDLDIIFNSGWSNSNYLSPTNVGRNQIIDWQIFYGQLRINYKNWFAQVYRTTSSTDDTYSIDERTKAYYTGIDLLGLSDQAARGSQSYSTGALFKDESKRWNAELQYNNLFGDLEVVAGLQWQQDQANSQNTYLLELEANDYFKDGNIVVNQFGGYAHLTYNFGGGWKALGAARVDNHEIYGTNFIPKVGLLKIGDQGTWRLTYGQGIAAPTILNMFGSLFNGLILGNAEGFTLIDGTIIEEQKVEKLQTIELGYRGQLAPNKLFVDANAFYNISEDFLSPLTVLGVATERGDTPMSEIQSGFNVWGGFVASYVNFGQVNTYGVDLSATYYFTPQFSLIANYSYFDWTVDEDDLENNDFNGDGKVNFLDILVNSPNHKGGIGLNYSGSKWFGGAYGRFVEAYNYFSSFQIASETIPGELYRGKPIVEDARSADTYNYGPLGGFFTVDLNLGYRFSDKVTLSLAAVNLFNQELREFTASAPTRGIYTLELRFNLPAIGQKN